MPPVSSLTRARRPGPRFADRASSPAAIADVEPVADYPIVPYRLCPARPDSLVRRVRPAAEPAVQPAPGQTEQQQRRGGGDDGQALAVGVGAHRGRSGLAE